MDEYKLANNMLPPGTSHKQRGLIGRCRAAYSFGERHKLDHFDKNALSKEICFCSEAPRTGGPGTCPVGLMDNPPLVFAKSKMHARFAFHGEYPLVCVRVLQVT